jgi:putative protease
LERKSSDRRIGVWARLSESAAGMTLTLTDEDGHTASAHTTLPRELAKDTAQWMANLSDSIGKMGATIFVAIDVQVAFSQPWFVPSSVLNPLRREVVEALEAVRSKAHYRLPRAAAIDPPAPYPDDALTYLGNVFNQKAHAFYSKHGVKVIDAAYESNEELGEVSLMITKHCVRFSLSLCPKQAKGVTGVQGTVKAEPLQLIHNNERLTLRFDCKPCEMHVVGKMKPGVRQNTKTAPLTFHKTKPDHSFGH